MSEEYWDEPEEFRPSRFDPTDMNYSKSENSGGFLPFALSPNKSFYESLLTEMLFHLLGKLKYKVDSQTTSASDKLILRSFSY